MINTPIFRSVNFYPPYKLIMDSDNKLMVPSNPVSSTLMVFDPNVLPYSNAVQKKTDTSLSSWIYYDKFQGNTGDLPRPSDLYSYFDDYFFNQKYFFYNTQTTQQNIENEVLTGNFMGIESTNKCEFTNQFTFTTTYSGLNYDKLNYLGSYEQDLIDFIFFATTKPGCKLQIPYTVDLSVRVWYTAGTSLESFFTANSVNLNLNNYDINILTPNNSPYIYSSNSYQTPMIVDQQNRNILAKQKLTFNNQILQLANSYNNVTQTFTTSGTLELTVPNNRLGIIDVFRNTANSNFMHPENFYLKLISVLKPSNQIQGTINFRSNMRILIDTYNAVPV